MCSWTEIRRVNVSHETPAVVLETLLYYWMWARALGAFCLVLVPCLFVPHFMWIGLWSNTDVTDKLLIFDTHTHTHAHHRFNKVRKLHCLLRWENHLVNQQIMRKWTAALHQAFRCPLLAAGDYYRDVLWNLFRLKAKAMLISLDVKRKKWCDLLPSNPQQPSYRSTPSSVFLNPFTSRFPSCTLTASSTHGPPAEGLIP